MARSPFTIIAMATLLFMAACHEDESTLDGVSVGVEHQSGVEPIASATELAVYVGIEGGYVAFLWLGGELPPICLDSDRSNPCEVFIHVETEEGIVLADVTFSPYVSSVPVLKEWKIRLPFYLDLFAIEGGPAAAYGRTAHMYSTLSLHGQSTDPFEAITTLVEAQYNPEVRY